MSIYPVDMTTYRSPMGTTVADYVDDRSARHDPAVAATFHSTSGHRLVPLRIQVARRRQELIDADTGPGVARDAEASLLGAVEGHLYRKDRAHGIAVGLACRAADDFSGYIGFDARLKGPQDHLKYIFGIR